MSTRLILSAAAVEDTYGDLINIYVMVSNSYGHLIPGLESKSFMCAVPQAADRKWRLNQLPNHEFVELEPGCYRIETRCGQSQPKIDCIALTVREWTRSLPIGTALTCSPSAEGNIFIDLKRGPLSEADRKRSILLGQ